jgi:hypothetical protein
VVVELKEQRLAAETGHRDRRLARSRRL